MLIKKQVFGKKALDADKAEEIIEELSHAEERFSNRLQAMRQHMDDAQWHSEADATTPAEDDARNLPTAENLTQSFVAAPPVATPVDEVAAGYVELVETPAPISGVGDDASTFNGVPVDAVEALAPLPVEAPLPDSEIAQTAAPLPAPAVETTSYVHTPLIERIRLAGLAVDGDAEADSVPSYLPSSVSVPSYDVPPFTVPASDAVASFAPAQTVAEASALPIVADPEAVVDDDAQAFMAPSPEAPIENSVSHEAPTDEPSALPQAEWSVDDAHVEDASVFETSADDVAAFDTVAPDERAAEAVEAEVLPDDSPFSDALDKHEVAPLDALFPDLTGEVETEVEAIEEPQPLDLSTMPLAEPAPETAYVPPVVEVAPTPAAAMQDHGHLGSAADYGVSRVAAYSAAQQQPPVALEDTLPAETLVSASDAEVHDDNDVLDLGSAFPAFSEFNSDPVEAPTAEAEPAQPVTEVPTWDVAPLDSPVGQPEEVVIEETAPEVALNDEVPAIAAPVIEPVEQAPFAIEPVATPPSDPLVAIAPLAALAMPVVAVHAPASPPVADVERLPVIATPLTPAAQLQQRIASFAEDQRERHGHCLVMPYFLIDPALWAGPHAALLEQHLGASMHDEWNVLLLAADRETADRCGLPQHHGAIPGLFDVMRDRLNRMQDCHQEALAHVGATDPASDGDYQATLALMHRDLVSFTGLCREVVNAALRPPC